MGHKVNPYGFRLGVIYPWKSNWYAGRDYADQLHEDVWIRKHIRKRLSRAGISSIDEWRADQRRFYDSCRDDTAVLLSEPGWRLTDEEPMVIVWFRLVEATVPE